MQATKATALTAQILMNAQWERAVAMKKAAVASTLLGVTRVVLVLMDIKVTASTASLLAQFRYRLVLLHKESLLAQRFVSR